MVISIDFLFVCEAVSRALRDAVLAVSRVNLLPVKSPVDSAAAIALLEVVLNAPVIAYLV